MSTKQFHVLRFWRKALREVCKDKGTATAGQVAKYVGQSRTTAKKYLDILVSEGAAWIEEGTHINGIKTQNYAPTRYIGAAGETLLSDGLKSE